jgi:hypothetical protein
VKSCRITGALGMTFAFDSSVLFRISDFVNQGDTFSRENVMSLEVTCRAPYSIALFRLTAIVFPLVAIVLA